MIKTWIRHFIYDISIDVLFRELYKNFVFTSMDFSMVTGPLDTLRAQGHIDGYTISYDPETRQATVDIDVSNPILRAIIKNLIDQHRSQQKHD